MLNSQLGHSSGKGCRNSPQGEDYGERNKDLESQRSCRGFLLPFCNINTLSGMVQHPLPQLGMTEGGRRSCPLEQLL